MKDLQDHVKAKTTIDIKSDGVYLSISLPEGASKPSISEVMDMIEQYGIDGVNIEQVQKIVKNPKAVGIIKISESTEVKSADEVGYITFEEFNMKAYVTFTAPINGGATFNKDDIYKLFETSGVLYGINDMEVERISRNREYHEKYLIAEGTPKEDGIDGYVDFFFNTKKKSLTPKQLDDGTVDYQNLELIEQTTAGETLLTIVPPTNGKNGKDVKGNTVHAKPGRQVEKLVAGNNVVISEDQKNYYSAIDGQIDYQNRKISILPVLEINGDIGHSTGNIEFNGSVIIKGIVPSNFSVKAVGNIEIYGIVEGAYVESSSDVFLYSGVMGNEKAIIVAGGDLTAKFIDSSKVSVNGSITARSIMHSDITADGALSVVGKRAVLVGGRACIGKEVDVSTIGSTMETRTEIIVGNTPAMLEKYRVLLEELEVVKHKINKTETIIKTLNSVSEELQDDKRDLLLKSFHTKIYLSSEKSKIEKDIRELLPKLENKSGKVAASEVIYPGVYVAIGTARLRVDNPIKSAALVNRESEVKIQSYY
ncbi:MAG: DUF342 domain-containing protein [Lachnospirales bacterium]